MKVGLIARCEDRGLGNLTREFYRAMKPDRTLLWTPHRELVQHFDWYDDFTRVDTAGQPYLIEDQIDTIRDWLQGLDVVYSAETFYDWRITNWAREQGVRTVCHMMPEYLRDDDHAQPDAWWTPTTWRLREIEERVGAVRVVPVPVALDRFAPHPIHFAPHNPIRWVHPGGARAAMDRNGTVTFMRALMHLREAHDISLCVQDQIQHPRVGSLVSLEIHEGGVDDYWRLWDGAPDACVLPRKYGGLCMPAQEAMAASCALVMTDCAPQRTDWPIIGIDGEYDGSELRAYGNIVPLAQVQPRELARLMDECAREPERIARARARARVWAEQHSWAELEHLYREELAEVVDSPPHR